ncbi:DNA polymerase delta subunit 2 [Halotydeus destructor]|nr:DNA polymerase delta subunit 2 [Halotydeus destructor]
MPIQRATCTYEDQCQRYVLNEKKFDLQYYPYYNARYRKMYEWTKEASLKKWGNEITIIKLNEIMDKPQERVCIMGTLLKSMKLQPSVLREISDDLQLIVQPKSGDEVYLSDDDFAMLQDDTESINLVGEGFKVAEHVTGVMMAVIGVEADNGNKFVVEDYCYPLFAPQKALKLSTEPKYVALISGIGLSVKPGKEVTNGLKLFTDFMTGCAGLPNAELASQIARVIVAGNCIAEDARAKEKALHKEDLENMDWTTQDKCYTLDTMKIVDNFLVDLGKHVELDVIPGCHDVTSSILPQQPYHPSILPKSGQLSSIKCKTNPYSVLLDGIQFMGTSGRVVEAIKDFSGLKEPVEILSKTLEWRHIIPTAPDTTNSYPYPDKDPFVLEECPHVYFAGNQDKFNTKIHEGPNGQRVRVISVPSFEKTRICVLVNLQNLECELLAFD